MLQYYIPEILTTGNCLVFLSLVTCSASSLCSHLSAFKHIYYTALMQTSGSFVFFYLADSSGVISLTGKITVEFTHTHYNCMLLFANGNF